MKRNYWLFAIGAFLSGLSGYIMSDLLPWEFVVGGMCFAGGVIFIRASNVVNFFGHK